jgi:hypothetical protein
VACWLAALFPLCSLTVAAFALPEARVGRPAGQWRARWPALREARRSRHLWAVAGFLLGWTFSPSRGTPLFFDPTDTLGFSPPCIGTLASLSSVAAIMGALAYAGIFASPGAAREAPAGHRSRRRGDARRPPLEGRRLRHPH